MSNRNRNINLNWWLHVSFCCCCYGSQENLASKCIYIYIFWFIHSTILFVQVCLLLWWLIAMFGHMCQIDWYIRFLFRSYRNVIHAMFHDKARQSSSHWQFLISRQGIHDQDNKTELYVTVCVCLCVCVCPYVRHERPISIEDIE